MREHPVDQLEDYALQLLPPGEQEAIAEHLAICAQCRDRVDSLERTLGLLALVAAPQTPPDGAADRLLQRMSDLRKAEERSLGPKVATRPSQRHGGALHHMRRVVGNASVPYPNRSAARPPEQIWRSRVIYGLVAVAAALAVAVGLLSAQTASLRQRNSALQARASAQQTALAIVAAPGAFVRQLAPTQQSAQDAVGAMAMDPKSGQGVLLISNLPTLPAGRTYEFWIVQQQRTPAGDAEMVRPITTFAVSPGQVAQVAFSAGLPSSEIANAGISIERAGGVAHPDSPMIMLFAA